MVSNIHNYPKLTTAAHLDHLGGIPLATAKSIPIKEVLSRIQVYIHTLCLLLRLQLQEGCLTTIVTV